MMMINDDDDDDDADDDQVSVHKEELIKFWKSSASGSGSRNFLKDSSTLRDRAFFHNFAHVCGQTDLLFVKILPQM